MEMKIVELFLVHKYQMKEYELIQFLNHVVFRNLQKTVHATLMLEKQTI